MRGFRRRRPQHDDDPRAARAFAAYERLHVHRAYRSMAWVHFLAFAVLSMLGRAAHPDDLPYFRFWLSMLAVGAGTQVLVFNHVALARRHPFVFGAMGASVITAMAGFHLGAKGGMDTPWFYASYVLPHICILFPCALHVRIPFTLSMSLPFLICFLGPHPEYLDYELAVVPMNYLIATHAVSIYVGHRNHRLFFDNFMARRDNRRQRRELAEFNADLTELVTARTEDLRDLLAHLEDVQDDERRKLSAELHDDFGQLLLCLRLETSVLGGDVNAMAQPKVAECVASMRHLVDELTSRQRQVVASLRPPLLDDEGVVAALHQLADRVASHARQQVVLDVDAGVVNVLHDDASALGTRSSMALYRLVQEGLTNAIKHAVDGDVRVRLSLTPTPPSWVEADDATQGVLAEVVDDGGDFDVDAALHKSGHWGLRGLFERLRSCGGGTRLLRLRRHTLLQGWVPLHADTHGEGVAAVAGVTHLPAFRVDDVVAAAQLHT